MSAGGDRTKTARPFSLVPIWFEAFACTMSLMAFVAIIGPISRILLLEPWQVGAAVTIAGLAWMIFARLWGQVSDRRGRRQIMLIGLAGFVISYALLCVFIDVALRLSLPAIIAFAGIAAGRTLAGVFYAAVPVTSVALIADHFPPEQRTKAIAGLGAANGVGMVIGPAVAGLLAPYGMTLPLILIAALPALALVVVWFALPRDERPVETSPSNLSLFDPRLRTALLVALSAMFAVSVAQITVGFYALDRLHLPPPEAARAAGIALGVVGIALIASQLLVRALNWPAPRLVRVGAFVSGLGFGIAPFANTEHLLWFSYFLAAAGMGFVFPAFSVMAANRVEPHEQGAAAGAVSSTQGLGVIVGPLAGMLIYQTDIRAPYVVVAALLITTAILVRDRALPLSAQQH